MKPSAETLSGLYVAALADGPVVADRVVELALRWGYSVSDIKGGVQQPVFIPSAAGGSGVGMNPSSNNSGQTAGENQQPTA